MPDKECPLCGGSMRLREEAPWSSGLMMVRRSQTSRTILHLPYAFFYGFQDFLDHPFRRDPFGLRAIIQEIVINFARTKDHALHLVSGSNIGRT